MITMNLRNIFLSGMLKNNMRFFIFQSCLLFTLSSFSQTPFKGKFLNKEIRIDCVLNLYADSIDVPGLEGLETCYGYISGNLNGTWVILGVKKLNTKSAVVRVTCDRGNDATDLNMKLTDDGFEFTQDDAVIKTVKGKNYVKLPKTIQLKRLK